ncbi:MAG: GH92 family glycosyl hydrolase [Ignavibacteriae bacterium]|nr:GH92 family glycosyl hydrolase [Ignavibacteriota bacterium]
MKQIFIKIYFTFFFSTLIYAQTDYTKYVNTFIGTAEHGHTYPGASLPFGMMQLSPDTGTEGWDWCSGYHASDNSIMGFSHTHLSGTGVGDYGDILFMPVTGDVKFNAGSKENPDEGYRSRFNQSTEKSSPGYYSVFLEDYKVGVELTTSKRSGIHKYKFSENSGNLIIDLVHGIQDAAIETYIKIIDNNKIEGYRTSSGWAKKHTIYFYAEFSQIISENILQLDGKELNDKSAKGQYVKAALKFNFNSDNELLVRIGISHVSIEGAKKNLLTEIPNWNFNKVKNNAAEIWNNWLSRIEVVGGTENQKITYYTSLYHAFLAPNIFSDVDKKYIGMDGKIKIAEDFDMYTIFSLWDTFRALHPLITILDEKLTNDLIKSLIAKYDESGLLPVWELASNETNTMIGYHSIPVIVDAFIKGIKNYDIEKAYRAMVKSSMQDERGLVYYKKMGFIPMDKAHDAVSSTLEYAYDDWCIAIMAKELGKETDYKYYMSRAKNYINMFDTKTKFMRGRYYSGEWSKNFDPISPSYLGSGEFTEGNSWQYSWFVPQDIIGLKKLIGGSELFKLKLDSLFTLQVDYEKYQMPSDVTGLIGQYAQGNEPSHHIAYLYNFCGYPWETQNILRKIMDDFFHAGRNGLCGNEDCGQMSAWYSLSAIGFYPVLPGSNQYVIGSPLFDKVTIHQENGKDFTIIANNNSNKNKFIQSAKLNGSSYNKLFFTHNDLRNGSTLEFEMNSEPNKNFGKEQSSQPFSEISNEFSQVKYEKYFSPVAHPHKNLFANTIKIELDNFNEGTEIRYSLDNSEPTLNSFKYTNPFVIEKSIILKAKVFGNDLLPSDVLEKSFTKSIVRDEADPFCSENGNIYPVIIENKKYHSNYTGGGVNALIDGNFASTDFRSPYWQGYEVNDCDIIIDLGKIVEVNKISANFLENQGSWIFSPQKVSVSFSENGKNYSDQKIICDNEILDNPLTEIKTFTKDFNKIKTRYIHFIADNIGQCPSFHKAVGGNAFMFIDEITIE